MEKQRVLGDLMNLHESKVVFQPHDLMILQNMVNYLDPLSDDPQRIRDYFFQKIFESPEQEDKLQIKLKKIEHLLTQIKRCTLGTKFESIAVGALRLNNKRKKILQSAIHDYNGVKIKFDE